MGRQKDEFRMDVGKGFFHFRYASGGHLTNMAKSCFPIQLAKLATGKLANFPYADSTDFTSGISCFTTR